MMRPQCRALLAAALLCASLSAHAQDQFDAKAAYAAFLSGHLQDAERAYHFLDAVGISSGDADVNLALVLRAEGENEQALPYWLKASLAQGADGFVFDQLGWSYLSAGDFTAARKAFAQGIERASVVSQQAEGNFALGLTDWMDERAQDSREALRKALLQGPYILPAASLVMAWSALKLKDGPAALAYFRQSLTLDPMSLETLRDFAAFERSIGENQTAWNLCRVFLSFDPADEFVQKMALRVEGYLSGNPRDLLPVRRLASPLLDPAGGDALPPSDTKTNIRVDLFSNRDAQPGLATRVYFMCNGAFHIVTVKSGDVIVNNGGAYQQWTAEFRPQSDVVEIRDGQDDLVYEARQPVRIEPQSRRGSILIKSAVFANDYGFDPGDREVRGQLEIWPTPYGFTMLNQVNLEDYLRGVVAAVFPAQSPYEAYEAEAVAARSSAYWYKAHAPIELQSGEICDSDACQQYLGVSAESPQASRAVEETRGVFLLDAQGKPARAREHVECGGMTEDGGAVGDPGLVSVLDAPNASVALRSPEDLERWTHSFPPDDDYDGQTNQMLPVAARWIRVLPEKDLRRRVSTLKYVGAIKNLAVTSRSLTGRVLALRVGGTRGELDLAGEKAIGDFLSPGSLRSNWFTILPIMDGRQAKYFILWGAGTGNGLGMCQAGAIGQAAVGRHWRDILTFYYPRYKIGGLENKPAMTSGKGRGHVNGHHHNPHWHGS